MLAFRVWSILPCLVISLSFDCPSRPSSSSRYDGNIGHKYSRWIRERLRGGAPDERYSGSSFRDEYDLSLDPRPPQDPLDPLVSNRAPLLKDEAVRKFLKRLDKRLLLSRDQPSKCGPPPLPSQEEARFVTVAGRV